MFLCLRKINMLLWFICKGKYCSGPIQAGNQCHLDLFPGDTFFLQLLRATVQMCIKESWWMTCCCTVRWSLYPCCCSTHLHTHTVLDFETLGLVDCLWLAHLSLTGWDSLGTGCACVTQVAVLQRFIPLQCCWVEGVVGAFQWDATVKALLWNSPPSPCFKLQECFNFLF